jgi:hypothetical protein
MAVLVFLMEKIKGGFSWIFSLFNVRYSTLLHLPPVQEDAGIEPGQLRLRL